MNKQQNRASYTYETAPDAPELAGMQVSSRMLRRAVEQGRITYLKFGNRVIFTPAMLAEFVERSTHAAVK